MNHDIMSWQCHQLDHMQITCTSFRQITTPAPHHSIFYRPDALPDAQPTVSKHWRQSNWNWVPNDKSTVSAMLHLRFCRAILLRDSDAQQSSSVRLHSRTLRLWRSVRQTNMASSDSDDAASKLQRATMKLHAATLSRVKVARQNRVTKSQV